MSHLFPPAAPAPTTPTPVPTGPASDATPPAATAAIPSPTTTPTSSLAGPTPRGLAVRPRSSLAPPTPTSGTTGPTAATPTTTPMSTAPPAASGVAGRLRHRAAEDDRGQATAEYGLVIIVGATIAVAVIAWATQSGAITGFFDAVVERLTGFL